MTAHAVEGRFETSVEAEGSDELKEFLMKYESDLKNSVDPTYSILIKIGLDKAELLEFDAVDLRQTLEEEGLKKLHIGRLIKTLRKIPESQIYIDAQKEPVSVEHLAVSSEEEKALNDITSIRKTIRENMLIIANTRIQLNTNYKSDEEAIIHEFDKIINIANERKDALLQKLKTLKENKNQELLEQMNNIKQYDEKLVKSYDESQKMIQNTSYDASKRKAKILATTADLVKEAEKWTDFKESTATIKTTINSKDLMNKLIVLGDVEYGDLPNAPLIVVKNVRGRSAMINIKNEDDVNGHKLEYVQVNDVHNIDVTMDDDMKTDWSIVDIVGGDKDIDYNLCGLKAAANYMIRGVSRNIHGFGQKSNISTFTTKSWSFDVVTDGYDDYVEDNSQIFNVKHDTSDCITISGSEAYTTGIHEFKIKIHSISDGSIALAVVSGTIHQSNKWIREHPGKYYYFNSLYGATYAQKKKFEKVAKWKQNDIVYMVLNCDDWTLNFKLNEISTKTIDIEKNKKYYACLCFGSNSKNVKLEIV